MKHTINESDIKKLINVLNKSNETARCNDVVSLLSNWLNDPILELNEKQRTEIKNTLSNYKNRNTVK